MPLFGDAGCARDSWSSPPDRVRRLRVLCDGYGLPDRERERFSGLVASRMATTASGIEDLVAGGSPAHERLVRGGVPTLVREDNAWVERNADGLDAAHFKCVPGG